MQKKSDNGNVLFKAGLFILFTLSLLIFSILWLRFFSLASDKTITAKFLECGPISKGVPVFYHGVNIGKIDKVDFSDDYKYTLIKILIFRKKMALPKNVYAVIKTEGLTGQKFVEILYPENPSKEILANGDVIEGKLSDFYEITKAVSQAVKNGQLKSTFGGFKNTAQNASGASKKMIELIALLEEIVNSNRGDVKKLIREAALSANNFHVTSASLKNLSTSPELQQDIKYSVSYIPKNSAKLDNIAANINKITVDIDKVTGNPEFQEGLLKAAVGTGNIADRLDKGDLNCLIKRTLEDTDKTINRYDCIGESFSEMMSERFLLTRLMFGRPGQSFQKCGNLQCIEEKISKPCPCPVYSCPNK